MKLHEIRELIKLVNQSSVEELEWEMDGTSIVIKKAKPALAIPEELPVRASEVEIGYQQAAATAEATEQKQDEPAQEARLILSPTVGLFYSTVILGQAIKSGELVGRCSVDTLQLSQDIFSPVEGEIADILVQDGQLVDYGKALLAVKQN